MRPFRALRTFVDPSAQGGFHWLHYLALLAIINVGLVLPIATGGRIASVGPVPLPKAGTPHKPTPRWLPNNSPLPPLSAAVRAARPPLTSSLGILTAWYVHGVFLNFGSYRLNFSAFINAEGDKYGVSPTFIAATIFTESGGYVYSERWGSGIDQSCGAMQQILLNVQALTGLSGLAACRWEENPYNSIDFGTRMLRDDMVQHGGRVPPPQAYVLYNAGSGYPDYWYFNPTGQAATNYYGNFLPNWYYALSHYATYGPAPHDIRPTPHPKRFHFPTKRWCRYDRAHHLKCSSAYWKRDQLGKVAFTWSHWRHAFHKRGTVDHVCGGVVAAERWNSKLRMEKQRFAHCIAYSWPHYRNDPVKWVKRSKARR